MSNGTLRDRMLRREILAGTFLKTPAHEMVELLARSGLDFVAIDAEHAPFDRGRLDACLAMARALNFPVLVRVPEGSAAAILIALDSGATGVIVPHVDNVERPEILCAGPDLARAAVALRGQLAGLDLQRGRCRRFLSRA